VKSIFDKCGMSMTKYMSTSYCWNLSKNKG